MELTGMSVTTGYHSHSTGNCKSKTTTLPTATAPDSQPNHIRNHRLFQLLTGWQLIRMTLYSNSTHNTWIHTGNFIFPFRANEKSRSKWASIELLVWAMIRSCQTARQCLSRWHPIMPCAAEMRSWLIVEHLFYTISIATNKRTPGIFSHCTNNQTRLTIRDTEVVPFEFPSVDLL